MSQDGRTGRPPATKGLKRENRDSDFADDKAYENVDGTNNEESYNDITESEYFEKLKAAQEEFADVESADDIREAYRKILIKNIANIGIWIERVGYRNPARALQIFKDLSEFVLPKLQRTDSNIDSVNPVQVSFESIDSMKARYAKKPVPIQKNNHPIKVKNERDGFL
jgi:hypothetical protein